jgi:hypothetical protein
MITTAEFAHDMDTGRTTDVVLQRAPTWAVMVQRVTDRIDDATGHRWCSLIARPIDRYVVDHSHFAWVPVDSATAEKIRTDLRTVDL